MLRLPNRGCHVRFGQPAATRHHALCGGCAPGETMLPRALEIAGLQIEVAAYKRRAAAKDRHAGASAFNEGRAPVFKGR